MKFPERLREIRKKRGLTQKKLGAMLNYGSSAIANYESGRNQPSIEDIIKIAERLDVSTDYLMGVSNVLCPFKAVSSDMMSGLSETIAHRFCTNEKIFYEIIYSIIKDIFSKEILPKEILPKEK